MPPKTYNELTLEQKVQLIKFLEEGNSERKTAAKFNVSKGTVGNIKKRGEEYMEKYQDESMFRERCRKLRKTENEELNNLVWDWFRKVRSADLPVSGPLIQEAAKKFAERLKKEDFVASNGWLECFRRRHDISFKILSGEVASADTTEANNFKAKIKEKCEGYRPEDIFNADETGLYFRALPNKSLVEKYKKAGGQKFSKEKVSILFAASSRGEKLQPLIIGKPKKARCFKNVNLANLPITYRSNKKAWMKSDLFEEWLNKINRDFTAQNRKVLLFIDNCSAHCEIKLSNVKIEFLPANTTSLVQPLDQGVIKSFKSYYRKNLLQHLITQTITHSGNRPPSYEINLLDAIYWIISAWREVKDTCIQNCFKKAGFLFLSEEDQPQIDVEDDEIKECFTTAKRLDLISGEVTPEEFISFDDEIPTDLKVVNSEDLISQILEEHDKEEGGMEVEDGERNDTESSSDTNTDTEDEGEENTCIPSYKDVFVGLKQLKLFALTHEPSLLEHIIALDRSFTEIQSRRVLQFKQSTLDSYFNSNT
jgi:transposase